MAHYIDGLKESIQDKAELNVVWSLSQAINYALKVEMQALRYNKGHQFRHNVLVSEQVIDSHRLMNSATPHTSKQLNAAAGTVGQQSFPGRMMDNRAAGRGKSITKENSYVKPSNIKCFRCFQQGHKFNECLSRPQLQLLDPDAEEVSAKPEVDLEEIQDDVEADVGEPLVCVIEKLLLAPKQPCVSQRCGDA